MWKPISKIELEAKLKGAETGLEETLLNIWNLIKIDAEKWKGEHGEMGDGFWVVALFGKNIIWYNDIEEGFNVSTYTTYGKIDKYGAEQDELNWTIRKIFNQINSAV